MGWGCLNVAWRDTCFALFCSLGLQTEICWIHLWHLHYIYIVFTKKRVLFSAFVILLYCTETLSGSALYDNWNHMNPGVPHVWDVSLKVFVLAKFFLHFFPWDICIIMSCFCHGEWCLRGSPWWYGWCQHPCLPFCYYACSCPYYYLILALLKYQFTLIKLRA